MRVHLAVRRGNQILMDTDWDGTYDKTQSIGNADEDYYFAGDWDGDGKDNIGLLRGNTFLMDINFDGTADKTQVFGEGLPPRKE